MADLDDEIAEVSHAYIGAAVTEIATLRADLFGSQVGQGERCAINCILLRSQADPKTSVWGRNGRDRPISSGIRRGVSA
jgi:hypothetical protein